MQVINILFALLALNGSAMAETPPPAPFPIFLKIGFSSVLEFEENPTRVVLGDNQTFQVEKLEKSLVVRTLVPFATTNMFVYFKSQDSRIFILTASEDAEPSYYRKFTNSILPKPSQVVPAMRKSRTYARGIKVISAKFDAKKDYLTIEIALAADSTAGIRPSWDLVRLVDGKKTLVPTQLWSERKDIQKDSQVRARFIFAKPNVARDLKNVSILIPLSGEPTPMKAAL